MGYWLIMILALAVDQGTKWLAQTRLSRVDTIPLVEDVFHLTYTRNTGAAFSILRNQQLLLIVITSAALLGLALWLARLTAQPGNGALKLSLACILAGGVGNLIDRVRLNYVIDMLDFRLINYPIFNVADCLVVGGTLLLGWLVLFRDVRL